MKKKDYSVDVGYKFITYSENGRKIIFDVEPMENDKPILYIPSSQRWAVEMPDWAQGRRDEIVERVMNDCRHIPYVVEEV